MSVIGCLFTLIFAALFLVLAFGLSILSAFLRLFGIGQSHTTFRGQQTTQSTQPEPETQKKVFSDDEGEYVDFEEVK